MLRKADLAKLELALDTLEEVWRRPTTLGMVRRQIEDEIERRDDEAEEIEERAMGTRGKRMEDER